MVAGAALDTVRSLNQVVKLRRNEYTLFDEWYNSFGFATHEGVFYDTLDQIETNYNRQKGLSNQLLYTLAIQP